MNKRQPPDLNEEELEQLEDALGTQFSEEKGLIYALAQRALVELRQRRAVRVDDVLRCLAETHDGSDLWSHMRREPEAFRQAVQHAVRGSRPLREPGARMFDVDLFRLRTYFHPRDDQNDHAEIRRLMVAAADEIAALEDELEAWSKNRPSGVSSGWVLNQLAGMKFTSSSGVYDYMKSAMAAAGVLDNPLPSEPCHCGVRTLKQGQLGLLERGISHGRDACEDRLFQGGGEAGTFQKGDNPAHANAVGGGHARQGASATVGTSRPTKLGDVPVALDDDKDLLDELDRVFGAVGIGFTYKGQRVDATTLRAAIRPSGDWTKDPSTRRSNTSARFRDLCGIVENIIRGSAHDLISGRAGIVAGIIMAKLAHEYGLRPEDV